jgi:hypothetical protein
LSESVDNITRARSVGLDLILSIPRDRRVNTHRRLNPITVMSLKALFLLK